MTNSSIAENNDQAAGRNNDGSSPIVETFLRLIRAYTFNTPFSKGKYRLYQTALKLVPSRPTSIATKLKDGRKLVVDLTTGMQETVFFLGEYETALTEILSGFITKGSVCLDVGANFGWYTTLMALNAGPKGVVYAFEPVPKTFLELKRNIECITPNDNVHINNLALGDREDTVKINLFDDQPSGHASLSTKGEEHFSSFECRMITFDSYMDECNVGDIDVVKIDIEGAEMMFLKGAERIFEQTVPPVFLIEMALAQASNFGYTPNDLITFISERAKYDFYKVDERWFKLIPIDGFAPDDIGANVFCVPQAASAETKAVVGQYLAE